MCSQPRGEPSIRWSQVGCRWSRRRRGAASRPPAQQRIVSPGSDSVMMRRLGLVIRGRDGLNTDDKQPRRIILDPSCRFRSSRPPRPRPRPPAPDRTPYRHTQGRARGPRWLEPVPQNPGSTNRIAGRAVCGRCRLGVPLPANCRLVWARSAEASPSQQPPANHERWRPLAWSGTRAMTGMRPSAAAAVRFFFPSTTAAGG